MTKRADAVAAVQPGRRRRAQVAWAHSCSAAGSVVSSTVRSSRRSARWAVRMSATLQDGRAVAATTVAASPVRHDRDQQQDQEARGRGADGEPGRWAAAFAGRADIPTSWHARRPAPPTERTVRAEAGVLPASRPAWRPGSPSGSWRGRLGGRLRRRLGRRLRGRLGRRRRAAAADAAARDASRWTPGRGTSPAGSVPVGGKIAPASFADVADVGLLDRAAAVVRAADERMRDDRAIRLLAGDVGWPRRRGRAASCAGRWSRPSCRPP